MYKKELPAASEKEFREHFAKDLDKVNEKAAALVAALQKESERTWMDYLQT
jgi:hypothetical protein